MFSLKLENKNGNIIDLNDSVKYQVWSCTGLNPPSADIFTSKSPNRKGLKYNGSTLYERNIVITIEILGDVEVNRNSLYEWIDTENYVKIHYQNGVKNVYCEGYVQDCEIDLFTDKEVVSLVIICPDPYWKDLREIATEISTLLKQFTFPFAIDAKGVPFSTIRKTNDTNIYNSGADTGCQIKITCNGEIENLIIYDKNDLTKQFRINTILQQNWIVVIDTDSSPKTCKAYKPDGNIESLLKYVTGGSDGDNLPPAWFTIKKGYNTFGYYATSGEEDVEMVISFTNKYLGV